MTTSHEGVVAQPRTTTTTRTRPGNVIAWVGIAVYCWIVGSFRSFTWQSDLAVLGPSIVIFGLGLARPPSRRPIPIRIPRRGAVAWGVPLAVFCVLEIVNDLYGSTYNHPTLSIMLDPVFDGHFWRSTGIFVWITSGWALARL